jgi:hypothetical protein
MQDHRPNSNPADRAVAWLIFVVCLVVNSWCGQVEGVNQNAHFAATRSLVERGTFDIAPLREKTYDVVTNRGRVYSNKPPGLALVGAVPYWTILHVERLLGLPSPDDSVPVDRFNLALLTVLLAGVPAALCPTALFVYLCREGWSPRTSCAVALAFSFGSTTLPYASMLYNHVLVTACLFGAWVAIAHDGVSNRAAIISTLLLGIAILSEYSAGPVAVMIVAYELIARRNLRRAALLALGPAVAVGGLMVYQAHAFDSPLAISYTFLDKTDANAFVYPPLFNWPQWERLYWITYQKERGLLYACPMYVLPVASMLLARMRPSARQMLSIAVVVYFAMLMLTYHSWAGGSGVGPRFLMPALPFLFSFAPRAFERLPWLAWPLVALSVFNMVAVTSVLPEYPGHVTDAPLHWDPVGVCGLALIRGQVAQNESAYNLGLLMGLRGAWSVLPVFVVVGSFLGILQIFVTGQSSRTGSKMSR